MANVHTPERVQSESFESYKARRAASNKINRDSRRDPNHGLVGARQQFRDSMRKSGTMGKRTRSYVALMAAWAQKRVSKEMNQGPKDERGAFTYTGQNPRRMWVAGISAQRGW